MCLPFLSVGLFCPAPVILSGAKDLAVLLNFSLDAVDGIVEVGFFQLTFPDDNHRPALGFQLSPDFLVAGSVSHNFGGPEVRVCLGNRVVLASFVTMPKATVDEDDGLIPRKDDVG